MTVLQEHIYTENGFTWTCLYWSCTSNGAVKYSTTQLAKVFCVFSFNAVAFFWICHNCR